LIQCSFPVVDSQAYGGVDHDWPVSVGS
jgi:hypothetical protein